MEEHIHDPKLQEDMFIVIPNDEEKYLTLCPLEVGETSIKLTKKTGQILINIISHQIQKW